MDNVRDIIENTEETVDVKVWRKMYGTVFVAADKALTLIEKMRFQEAMEVLQAALTKGEDLYIEASLTPEELAAYKAERESGE